MADPDPDEAAAAEAVPDETPEYGPVEAATRADIDALMTAHPMGESLSELAYSLAHTIDQGPDDRALAGIAKELRATLNDLARLGDNGDDDLDTELSAPVRDEKDPE